MSLLGLHLRSFLLTDPDLVELVDKRVHEDVVPELTGPQRQGFVYFVCEGTERVDLMDDERGALPHSLRYAIECVSPEQSRADELADVVAAWLHLYAGAFGTTSVQRIFVEDQSDDYVPRANGGDAGLFVRALQVQVFL